MKLCRPSRRRTFAIACVIAVAALALWRESRPIHADVYAGSQNGVGVGIEVRFLTPRTITDAKFTLQGASATAGLYDNGSGADADVQADPFKLPMLHHLLVETAVIPACDQPVLQPTIEITSEFMGRQRVDTHRVSNTGDVTDAIKQWCKRGPEFTQTRSSLKESTRDFSVVLTVTNPQQDPMVVVSRRVDTFHNHWDPATVTIPPRSTAELTITGNGDLCDTPWSMGLLSADGLRLPMSPEYAEVTDQDCAQI